MPIFAGIIFAVEFARNLIAENALESCTIYAANGAIPTLLFVISLTTYRNENGIKEVFEINKHYEKC